MGIFIVKGPLPTWVKVIVYPFGVLFIALMAYVILRPSAPPQGTHLAEPNGHWELYIPPSFELSERLPVQALPDSSVDILSDIVQFGIERPATTTEPQMNYLALVFPQKDDTVSVEDICGVGEAVSSYVEGREVWTVAPEKSGDLTCYTMTAHDYIFQLRTRDDVAQVSRELLVGLTKWFKAL